MPRGPEAASPRHAPWFQSSGAIVISQPWIQLTGSNAWVEIRRELTLAATGFCAGRELHF